MAKLTDKAMLIDTTKCIGCRACQVACKQWNKRPAEKTKFTGSYQNPPKLSGSTWTLIKFIEPEDYDANPRWLFRKEQCFHCTDASCEAVCPTGAIKKRDDGIVYIDQDLCAGCKYCVYVCPFGVPHPDSATGTARKCWMCLDRLENGLTPACAKVCPTGAVSYGTRKEMLMEARKREFMLKNRGIASTLYGEHELGGLHVMTILTEAPETYGLPSNPVMPNIWYMTIWKWILGAVPGAAILVSMLVYFFATRDDSCENAGGEI